MSDNGTTRKGIEITPRMWVGAAITLIALAFIMQNRQAVAVNLLWVALAAPLWVVLTSVFVAGGATGWLMHRRTK